MREISKYAVESAYVEAERSALSRSKEQESPRAILLGGQPGSGKSALAAEAERELRSSGGVVVIDADRLREDNPRYKQLSREDPQNAADKTQKEAGEWATRLTMAAVEGRRNLVVDGTMRNPENIRGLAERLNEKGYQVEVRVLAVNQETSLTRARLRFEEQVSERGTGRFVNKAQHDNAYEGIVGSVRAIESEKLANQIKLYDANQKKIYENTQEQGAWKSSERAVEVLEKERARPWTHAEMRDYVSALQDINALAKQREDAAAGKEGAAAKVIGDRQELMAKLEVAKNELSNLEKSTTYLRAQAFDQLSKSESLARFPELDGAYKQLHEVKQGWTSQVSQSEREISYSNARAAILEQLHKGGVPEGSVTLDESRKVIGMAADHRGLVVRDAQELKQDVKGEVVANSSHHTLVKMSEMVAVRFEKQSLDREVAVGEKVAIQHGGDKSQVYEQGKEPSRENARDVGREIGR